MKHKTVHAAAALAVAYLTLAPAIGAAQADKTIAVPRFEYTARTLANGLKVYAMRDPKSPTATVDIWYGVGSRDDPRGRSGFAHLFEHMMFRDTRDLSAAQSDALVDDAGGSRNGATGPDYTIYTTTVPSNYLEPELWLEGERLSSLVIDKTGFEAERHVVEEEMRQRIYTNPYGRILYVLEPNTVYRNHPYALRIGGSDADLDAATAEDARAFHESFYRPDNAIAVVSGNFDPAALNRWVDRYLGAIPNPPWPLVKDHTPAPEGAIGRTVVAYAPNVPLPAIVRAWHAPPADSDDFAAMQLLESMLGDDPSSLLHRALVSDSGLASRVYVTDIPADDGGVFAATAILAAGKTVVETDMAFSAVIARLRDQPIPAAELDRFKNRVLANALRQRETAEDRAEAFGTGAGGLNDPGWSDRMLADIRAMTPEGLQRVVRRYLAENRRIDIHYLNESQRASGPPETPLVPPSAIGASPSAPRLDPVALLPEAERQAPPEAGAVLPAEPPAITQRTLPNGLKVFVATSADSALTSIALEIGDGSAVDPKGEEGLTAMTAALTLRGSDQHSANDLQDALANLGATLTASTDVDGAVISLSAPESSIGSAGNLMAEAVRHPTFIPEEVERQRSQNLDELTEAMSQPVRIALRLTEPLLYGEARYGRLPTQASLKSIGRDDVAAWWRERWRPDNAALVITGARDAKAGFALAEQMFGSWAKPSLPMPADETPSEAKSNGRVLVVDMPKSGQSAVFALMPGVARDDPAFAALGAGNVILSKNLNLEVRIKRGLSYGSGSMLIARRDGGHMQGVAQTKNENAAEVADLILGEFDKFGQSPMDADELRKRTALLAGNYESKIESADGLAKAMVSLVEAGAPATEVTRFISDLRAQTPATVQAAARAKLRPLSADLLIVGDASKFLDALKKHHPNVEVLRLDDVRNELGRVRHP